MTISSPSRSIPKNFSPACAPASAPGKLHDELVRKATGSQALNAQLTHLNSRLEQLAITDELTGLFNRRHAMSRLEEQWALVERYGRPLSIAMIDIDHFKKINDIYGHHAGDAILRRVADYSARADARHRHGLPGRRRRIPDHLPAQTTSRKRTSAPSASEPRSPSIRLTSATHRRA